ncbi:MAG: hypothetical protein ACRC5H_01865 [Treponemataceae bacterium]
MKDRYAMSYRRMIEIDKLIREGMQTNHHPTVKEMTQKICQRLKVSVTERTIQRDIKHMAQSADFIDPIPFDENYGYYYANQNWSFSDIQLSDSEKQCFTLARSVLLSLFSGTTDYYEIYKTFNILMGKFDFAQNYLQHPLRDSMLLALPQKTQLDDIDKIIPFINTRQSIVVLLSENTQDFLIRPIYVVYAWSHWYLLYIDAQFSYEATQFKIIRTDCIQFKRSASQSENTTIPQLEYKNKSTYDFSKAVYTSCEIKSAYQNEEDFEYLSINIYGNLYQEYSLKFRQNKDSKEPQTELIHCNSMNFSEKKFEEEQTKMFLKARDFLAEKATSQKNYNENDFNDILL